MIYGSVCSGIEAASVAWHPLGWRASFLSEIEPFPRSVLSHHYPDTPLHGDFTTIQDGMYEPIDLLVGGTPCQSFSVAGLRAGLDDPRGNLMLEFGALAKRLRPTWLVWENVPGVLSSNGGRDFGSFLAMLGQLGYGFAYRVLDAQYFGVAQRRRRVFVVGYLGDWRRAAAVLFESDCLRGNPAPSREAGKEIASDVVPSVAGSLDTQCGGTKLTHQSAANGHLILEGREYTGTLTARMFNALGARDIEEGAIYPVKAYGIPGNWIGRKPENGGNAVEPMLDVAPCQTKTDRHGVAYAVSESGLSDTTGSMIASMGTGGVDLATKPMVLANTLTATGIQKQDCQSATFIPSGMAVRRLTPTECERLQGFPDGYTQTPHNGKPASDGPRYKALGNSMAVPVMAWIGKRIDMVNKI